MTICTRSATRNANVPLEPLRASTSKPMKTRSRPAIKRTRKVVEAPVSVVPREEDPVDVRKLPKWQAIFAEHPPLAVLPPEFLPHLDGGANAPHFMYGWAFDKSCFLELARRRRLTFSVESCYRRRFGGSKTFNFGDLTEDHINNPALSEYLHNAAFLYVRLYISEQTNARFTVRQPLSQKWRMMFVLWTNYDIKEKYATFKVVAKWSQVKTFMNELLNECLPPDSERSEPLWWWSVSNNFVRF